MGRKSPKKPREELFLKIDVAKRYVFISNYEQLFRLGEDWMVEVDRIDYGRPWESLKEDEEGDTMMFEITDFEVISTEEREAWLKQIEEERKKKELIKRTKMLENRVKNKVKRIIMQEDFRMFYWSPCYTLGRLAMILIGTNCDHIMNSLSARFGLFIYSHTVAYCLRWLVRG